MNEVHQRRMNKFIEEGLNEQDARSLADQMHRRDTEGFDDRRVCFECKNYTDKYCMKMRDSGGKPQKPLRFVMQRCDDFQLRGIK